jgi:hypothetical protein
MKNLKNLFKENSHIILVLCWFAFITLIAILFSGCEGNVQVSTNPHRLELDSTSKYYDRNYRVYTLEGCEYIVQGVGNSKWGTHKGNCKNPIHYAK